MILCNKVGRICDKAQYNEATFFEILLLKFHLTLCNVCAKHSKKNGELTHLCSKANLKVLSKRDKTRMKDRLKREV
jgi:hypothetical protein